MIAQVPAPLRRPTSFEFGAGPPRGARPSLDAAGPGAHELAGSDLGSEIGDSRPASLDYGPRARPRPASPATSWAPAR